MIEQKQSLDQLPKEIKPAFQELNVLKHLNAANVPNLIISDIYSMKSVLFFPSLIG
jgi:hypothetical protein